MEVKNIPLINPTLSNGVARVGLVSMMVNEAPMKVYLSLWNRSILTVGVEGTGFHIFTGLDLIEELGEEISHRREATTQYIQEKLGVSYDQSEMIKKFIQGFLMGRIEKTKVPERTEPSRRPQGIYTYERED